MKKSGELQIDVQQIKLYQQIQEFALDEADVAFPLRRLEEIT